MRERIVNAKIFEALPVHIKVMPLKEAKELGAMALFGEKYGDIVRVVDVEGFSTEFCGGTQRFQYGRTGLLQDFVRIQRGGGDPAHRRHNRLRRAAPAG